MTHVIPFPAAVRQQPWRSLALRIMSDGELEAALEGQDTAEWLDAAASSGGSEAQLRLGRLLLNQPRDPRAAFACFLCAARGGNAEAWYLLGRCYEKGWGVAVNPLEARNSYRQAAEGGDFRGAYNYAGLAVVDGCITGALHWFERALLLAPDAARAGMLDAMMQHPHADIRALAEQG